MYYPDQRVVSQMMRIKRHAMLPEGSLGSVRVERNAVVDVRDTVARGLYPARYIVVDAMQELGLRQASQLQEMMFVDMGTPIPRNTVIAGRDMEHGKRIIMPVDVIVLRVEAGRIIMQEVPDVINIQAGVRGRVTQIHENRGVTIEATGGVIQGVWGNGGITIATLQIEPEGGLESLSEDSLDTALRGSILITRRSITEGMLNTAQARAIAGIIGPSMDATLMAQAIEQPFAIMLTGGFGDFTMQRDVFSTLQGFDQTQGVLDAALPQRFNSRRPGLVIHQPATDDTPAIKETTPLRVGMTVRITRQPYLGRPAKVVELPPAPVLLENGLRVPVARVEVDLDEIVDVPLANIELAGG